MRLSREDVLHIALLARLGLTETEVERLSEQLSDILEKTDEIRIWSAGCSSGEEPYSVAMMLAEMLGDDLTKHAVKIHATDIDETALKFARSGTYTSDQLAGISEDMRKRYFAQSKGTMMSWILSSMTWSGL